MWRKREQNRSFGAVVVVVAAAAVVVEGTFVVGIVGIAVVVVVVVVVVVGQTRRVAATWTDGAAVVAGQRGMAVGAARRQWTSRRSEFAVAFVVVLDVCVRALLPQPALGVAA